MDRKYFHWAFEIGIVWKGINGFLEVVAGILLILVPTATINEVLLAHTQISEDISVSSKMFGAVYLLAHGIVKLGLFITLQRKQLWAYPVAMAFLAAFVMYQCYHLSRHYTIWLAAFTVGDMFIIFFIWNEYQSLKKSLIQS